RGDGVGRSGVSKAVTAGAVDGYLKSGAAEGLRYGGVGAGAVEDDVGGDAAGIRALAIEMADAAEVAFAFFADVTDEEERRGEFHLRLSERMRDGQHA